MLCDRSASNVWRLQLSASMPLASVLRRCISYSRRSRDVGDVAAPPLRLARPPITEDDGGGGGAPQSRSELPLLELGVVA